MGKTVCISLSIILYFIGCLEAQISSSTANYSDTIPYKNFSGKDLFFIFHVPENNSNKTYGTLQAQAPGADTGDFEWGKYDTSIHDFGSPFFYESGVTISKIENLESGGYRVRIRTDDLDTVFRAWVFINDPYVAVDKNEEGKVILYRYTCDYLDLNGFAEADTHIYYDLETRDTLILPNGMEFEWTSDNPDIIIPGAKKWLNPNRTYSPPTKDTWYILTAVDSFGLMRDDSVFYETIHVKADFSILIEDEENPGNWIESENPAGEAPLEVKFLNLSENGEEFEWTFVDSAKTGQSGKMATYDISDTAEYTYYIPRNYYPSLIAISEAGCIDSIMMTTPVHVEPSELDIMNVFSPNNDGVNDVFIVKAKSLKEFRITIYNRYGRLVYEHVQTEDKFEWEGWDGTVLGRKDKYAEPGVYFFVIEAIGWDAEKYRGGIYRGYVYLFR